MVFCNNVYIEKDSIDIKNDTVFFTTKEKCYERYPSKPIQIGIMTAWITGLIIFILILKKQ